jgi:inward rectifier potassium channel
MTFRRKKKKQPPPLHRRLVPRGDDGYEVVRIGRRHFWISDLYIELLSMPWIFFFVFIILVYFTSNLVFAELYFHDLSGIENARPNSFIDMFFFSVQTMSTIGYGKLTPVDNFTNSIVTVEALWGFTFFAFIAALAFARFSRPTARVLFSNIAVISNYEGKPHLKIRVANQRTNRIVGVSVNMVLLRDGVTKEGYRMRRFYDLKLVRDRVPLLQLTWTLLHPIDEKSPLYGATAESLQANQDEIIVSLSGYDETLSQTIHARHSYIEDEIECNAFFEDVITRREDGRVEVNYNLFHSFRPAEEQNHRMQEMMEEKAS